MNVALAGLTAREELALEMLVGRSLPGWQCSTVPAGRNLSLPPADLYVVDLAGRGRARWTDAAQDELLQALGGAPAVLVAPAFDQTWTALDAKRMASQPLVLLHKPYGIEEMRAALKQAAAGRASRSAAVAFSSAPSAPALAASTPEPVPAASSVANGEMSASEFQARLDALPASEPQLFLRQLAEALALRQPFEVRVNFLNRLIVHPDEQWVASNTPVSVQQGLCRSDSRASATAIDAIDGMDAMARAQRLDMPLQPLDAFLGSLMQERLGSKS